MLSYYYYRQKKLSAKRSGCNPPFLQEVLRTPQDKPAYAGADSLYSIPYPSPIFKGSAGRGICTGAVPLYTHLSYTECKKQLRGKCVSTPRSFFVLRCRRNSHVKYAFRKHWIAGPGGPGVKKRQRNGKAATLPFLCGYLTYTSHNRVPGAGLVWIIPHLQPQWNTPYSSGARMGMAVTAQEWNFSAFDSPSHFLRGLFCAVCRLHRYIIFLRPLQGKAISKRKGETPWKKWNTSYFPKGNGQPPRAEAIGRP